MASTRATAPTALDSAQLDLPLPLSTLIGLIVGVIAVAIITLLTYRAMQSRQSAVDRVTTTLESIQQLESVLSSLKDAETAQRGYLLTGDERYAEPFALAQTNVPTEIAALKRLATEATQQANIESLERLAQAKLAELGETMAMRRAGDAAGALAVVRSDRGKAAMDQIRTLVADMERNERAQLAVRQDDYDSAVTLSTWAVWGGSAVLVLLMILAAAAMARDFRERDTQAWIRGGQVRLVAAMQGEQRLESLGEHVVTTLAELPRGPGRRRIRHGSRRQLPPRRRPTPCRRARAPSGCCRARGSSDKPPRIASRCT